MPPADLFTQRGADRHAWDGHAVPSPFGCLLEVTLRSRCPGFKAEVSEEGKPQVGLTTGWFGICEAFPVPFSLSTGTKSERNFPPQRQA